MDGETQDDGSTLLMRQLRALVGSGGAGSGAAGSDASDPDTPSGWRDDLRLFALTWAAGFVFFLILFA